MTPVETGLSAIGQLHSYSAELEAEIKRDNISEGSLRAANRASGMVARRSASTWVQRGI